MKKDDKLALIILWILKKNDCLMTRNDLLTELRQHLEAIDKVFLWAAFPNSKIEVMVPKGLTECPHIDLTNRGRDRFKINTSGHDYLVKHKDEAAKLGISS